MFSETLVRVLFALIFFTVVIVGGYFRHTAHRQKDHFERMKHEGPVTFLFLRIFGGLLWIQNLLFPFFPGLFDGVRLESTAVTHIAGLLMALAALPMGYSVFRSIGRNITDTVQTRAEHQLITSGIYRYIRHPLYTTGFLLFFGLGLFAGLWPAMVLSIAVLVVLFLRTFTEEEHLIARFGEQYVSYAARTRKFFPKIL